jgi:hypothetical protein
MHSVWSHAGCQEHSTGQIQETQGELTALSVAIGEER